MTLKRQFLYTRRNYCLLLIALSLIVSGYLLMTGSGNTGGNEFNNEIYSFRRITLAPIVLLTGYVAVIVAIIWNPKKTGLDGKSHNGKI